MHIMEGYLDPIWCAVWFILAIPFVVLGARAVVKLMREHPEQKMTVALSGAFIFLLSSMKLPSMTGSSSHPTGTGLSAVLYGVSATSFLALIVLIFQAILLAHGGITTLGANVFSMGIFGPLCGILVWNVMRKAGAGIAVSMLGAAVFANLCTYVCTSVQMGLNWGGYSEFLTTFAITQIPLSIMEGILFYMFANYLLNNKPEVFETAGGILFPSKDVQKVEETGSGRSRSIYIAGFVIIAAAVIAILWYGSVNGFGFGGADDAAGSVIGDDYVPWFTGIFGDYELPGETESMLFALQAAIGAIIIGFFIGRYTKNKEERQQSGGDGPKPVAGVSSESAGSTERYYYR